MKFPSVKISKNKIKLIIPLFVILFYCYTRMSFGEKISFKIYLVVGLVAVIFFALATNLKRLKFSVIDLVSVSIIVIMFLWNNWDFGRGIYTSAFNITALFLIFIFASKNNRWIDFAFRFSVFVGLFYAFWTIVSWLSPTIYYSFVLPLVESSSIYNLAKQYSEGFIAGMTAHYSTTGLYLSSGICFTWGMYFFNGRKLSDVSLKGWFYFGFQIFALLLTGKRGPIIYLALAFFLNYIVYNVDKPISRYFKLMGIGLAAICVFFVAAQFVPSLLNFVIRFQTTMESGDITMRRFDLWSQAWDAFLKNPLLGNGWYWFRYHNMYGLVTYHVHNCYIQWLCELGIIGSIPFFFFTIVFYIRSIIILRKVRKNKKISVEFSHYLAVPLCYQTFFICMSFAGTAFYEAQSLCPYIISCAFVQYIWRKYHKFFR